MTVTAAQLIACGVSPKLANFYLDSVNQTLEKYSINTPLRICHFLAQVLHESGKFVYNKELASGQAYEGRKDLGDIHTGDGVKYKGRGFIQITGLSNYKAITESFNVDFVNNPVLLEQSPYCALSAGWFWNNHNLNALADIDHLIDITHKINGGENGIDDRRALLIKAKSVFKI